MSRASLAMLTALCVGIACNGSSKGTAPAASADQSPASASTGAPSSATSTASTSEAPEAAELPPTPSKLSTHTFTPTSLGVAKTYRVYEPKGYEGSEASFPVVVMLHGLGGNQNNWLEHGQLQQAADAMSLRAIVVMPDGDASFYMNRVPPLEPYEACLKKPPAFNKSEPPAEYCVKSARYEDYILRDLLADVGKRYRVIDGRDGRAIAGLSMGGHGALAIAFRNPNAFVAVAAHSAPASLLYEGPFPYAKGQTQLSNSLSTWGSKYPAPVRDYVKALFSSTDVAKQHDPATLGPALGDKAPAIYFDCGESDGFGFANNARHLDEVLTSAGVNHTFELAPGGHDFTYWKARLPRSLAFLATHLAPPR